MRVLVSRCRRTKYVTATVVPRKGPDPYAVRRLGQDLTQIYGYKRVVLKSDQEQAIKKLKSQVRLDFDLEIPEEQSCAYDSQSNAEVENSIQQVEGQIRTVKLQLEHRLGDKLPIDSPLLPWLVRHSGATLSRYQKGTDGQTAYRRLRGRPFNRTVTEFGECIWYYVPKSGHRGKIDARWNDGVFLGCREEA